MKHNLNRGFTILELLVVILIIGLISVASIVLMSGARQKSRDARRMNDIKQVQNALNLYAASNRNLFPSLGAGTVCTGGDFDGTANQLASALAPTHIPLVPAYQQYNATTMYGRYCSIGGGVAGSATAYSYEIQFCLEGNGIRGYLPGCYPAVSSNVIRP